MDITREFAKELTILIAIIAIIILMGLGIFAYQSQILSENPDITSIGTPVITPCSLNAILAILLSIVLIIGTIFYFYYKNAQTQLKNDQENTD